MIDMLNAQLHQYYYQVITWYSAAGALTQYAVIVASGTAVFLISVTMVLSRIIK